MPQFQVPLAGGGSMTVNASSQAAANGNVGAAAAVNSGGGGGGGGGGGSPAPAPSSGGGGAPVGSYNTVNGQQTIASMASQLQGVGWGGNANDPAAVTAAYASTTKGAVTPGTGAAPTSSSTGAAPPKTTDTSGLAQFASQTSGVTDKQLAQQKAEFDAQLQFAKDQMTQLGIPQLQINQTLAALQQSQFQAQIGQINAEQTGVYQPMTYVPSSTPGGAGTLMPYGPAQQTLAAIAQAAQLSGMYQGAPTEAASEFARTLALQTQQLQQQNAQFLQSQAQQQGQFQQTLGLQQGQLGQQYLATAAQLQGPQNTFQLSNYMRGAQGNQAVPTYLSNLASNIATPAFQGTGTTPPTPQTAAGLAQQLGGQTTATPGWDYNQTLQAIQGIMGKGAQSLGPGTLERLNPDELAAFGSGLSAVGGSLPAFLQQYAASRVGQQAPITQTTLA